MNMDQLLSYDWSIMMPEFTIAIVATAISLLDLFMPKHMSRRLLALFAVAGIAIAFATVVSLGSLAPTSILEDTFYLDTFGKLFKLLLLFGTGLIMLLSFEYKQEKHFEYRGEFYYLLLSALLGAMIMTSSADLITLFVGLELLSISSYILVGMRKNHLQSNEASMKYVINGGISTALTLFGMSYVYGFSGTTNLKAIYTIFQNIQNLNHQYVLVLALLIMFVGLSFKITSAPFHMWAPDVYQGAPLPVTAFLSVISKTAGFVIILRIMLYVFNFTFLAVQDYIAVLAALSMIVGNVVALRQRNIKRMLAYSGIAQGGYILVAFVSVSLFMFDAIWFYLMAYMFMSIGIFALMQVIIKKEGSEDIEVLSGLYRRSPMVAIAFAVFILSLAGIPGTAGFIGKINIFMGALAVTPSHYILAATMLLTTVISYVYYFGLLTQIFFRSHGNIEKLKLPSGVLIVVVICFVGTVLFGVAPSIAYDFLTHFDHFRDFLGTK